MLLGDTTIEPGPSGVLLDFGEVPLGKGRMQVRVGGRYKNASRQEKGPMGGEG